MSKSYPHHYSLNSFESPVEYSKEKNSVAVTYDVPFPAEAFASILRLRKMPLPKGWDERFPSKENEVVSSSCDEPEGKDKPKLNASQAESIDEVNVVPGISVIDLRNIIDENAKKTFRPRLLAALRVELEMNRKRSEIKKGSNFSLTHRLSEDSFMEETIREQCESLGITSDKAKKGNVSDQDIKAIKRVLNPLRVVRAGAPKKY